LAFKRDSIIIGNFFGDYELGRLLLEKRRKRGIGQRT
jgi:hypothetical protein